MSDPGRDSLTSADQHPLGTLQPGCAGCQRNSRSLDANQPLFIAMMNQSLIYLHEDQRYPGHCVVFARRHADHLHTLSLADQMQLWAEVGFVARAVNTLFQPKRINYECLGNVLAHVHWHVIPRYEWDPEPQSVIWVRPAAERATGYEPAKAVETIEKIRETLKTQAFK